MTSWRRRSNQALHRWTVENERKWGAGTVVIVAVLIGLLGLAIYMGYVGWGMGGAPGGGESMSAHGFIAMGFGIVATLALGIGLMWLVYYSSKSGRD